MENCFTKNTDYEVDFIIKELSLKTGDKILDMGCGTGRHSVELAKKGMLMTGIDLSNDMLNIAKQKAKKNNLQINFIQGDASKTKLDDKFDHAILICEGAFCLFEGDMDPYGKFLMNALNGYKKIREHSDKDISDGIFDPLSLTTTFKFHLETGEDIVVYEKGFLPLELSSMLEEAGFKVLNLWGGTAGSWNKEPLKLDEYEIMALSQKQG